MTDLISRQAAIDAISKYASIWMEYTDGMRKEDIAEEALKSAKSEMIRICKELPSAEPERKTGKWIKQYDEEDYPLGCKCSECEKTYVMPEGWANFCPNCGAEMIG